jgi:probable HAF family extracellular repeat protein
VRILTALAVLVAASTSAWTAKNLGTPQGHPLAFVQAIAVNAHGIAVAIGDDGTNKPQQQAFVWQQGRKTALTYRRVRYIEPFAIDGVGDVLGAVRNTAVLWRKGVPKALGTFSPSGMSHDGSLVVGTGYVHNSQHAFLWRKGTLTDLPGLGGTGTNALAVNGSGTVVGFSALPSGVDHAVVWRGGKPTDLGSVNGLDSFATLITAKGTIYGFASLHDGSSSVVLEWKSGQLIDLGTFGADAARPVAVNAHGDVLIQTETGESPLGLFLLRGVETIRVAIPALGDRPLSGIGLDDEDDVVGSTPTRGFLWRNGRATLLPADDSPVAVAGGWVVASKTGGGAVRLRLRR